MRRPRIFAGKALEYRRLELGDLQKAPRRSGRSLLPLLPSAYGRGGHAQQRGENRLAHVKTLLAKPGDALFWPRPCGSGDLQRRRAQLSGAARVLDGFAKASSAEVFRYPGRAHLFADESSVDYDPAQAAVLIERDRAFVRR